MNSLGKSHRALRAAVGPITNRIITTNNNNNNNTSPPLHFPDGSMHVSYSEGGAVAFEVTRRGSDNDNGGMYFEDTGNSYYVTSNNNDALPLPLLCETVHVQDVDAIQSGVSSMLNALQTSDQMTPAQLSLIKTVRETAADPDIMFKIVNNGSFQDFMANFIVPQIAESSSSGSSSSSHSERQQRNTLIIDESEEENVSSCSRRSSISSATSDTDEEIAFLEGRSRRVYVSDSDEESQTNRTAQQKALTRLNELCHQISPDLVAPASLDNGWRRRGSVSSTASDTTEDHPAPGISKPTMEGAGMPGVPQPPPAEVPLWANPVCLLVVTACVIPLTILAVTAVVYPSPRTWSLLKTGFRAVCSNIGIM